ncbi:hypothetical protein H9Q10_10615 [Eikenella sp. S3360]|uniref:Lipoprotein n=1 Tax=Eikenella glucosivorans TaxID=2766967 RepID=A0ABS0NCW5_9NEIS|nr:hypothetical protein [Eikenella glucosivorans]MBH5330116.1 hypothetical protein [Eikenella glucosivorans]
MFAKSLLKPLLLTAALLLLNGCATGFLWKGYDSEGSTTTSTHTDQDTVVGFARAKPDSRQLVPNSIVMLGDRYIYVLDKGSDPRTESGKTAREVDLGAILDVKLSRPFQMYDPSNDPKNCCGTRPWEGFRLTARSPSAQHFCSADFDLVYQENPRLSPAERRRERAELERLQFRQVADSRGESRYARTIRVCGQRYTRPGGMKDDYRFETPIPVTISSTVTRRGRNVSGAVGRALVTPFTAAVDIVTLPIVLPFAAFALKDGIRPVR